MMPNYSNNSLNNLLTSHKDLVTIFTHVINYFDNTIICGHRNKYEQDKAYEEGNSQVKYPFSKHNSKPSMAIDAVTYPINWEDVNQHYYFSGYVKAVADLFYEQGKISHKVRCGADWNKNMQVSDENFMDLFHFELYKP
jgi:peptidoglycan LD-endopeptidase CwlK